MPAQSHLPDASAVYEVGYELNNRPDYGSDPDPRDQTHLAAALTGRADFSSLGPEMAFRQNALQCCLPSANAKHSDSIDNNKRLGNSLTHPSGLRPDARI